MLANNGTGIIQPVNEISKIAKDNDKASTPTQYKLLEESLLILLK